MNEHILEGPLTRHIMGPGLNLREATHTHWMGDDPNIYIRGSDQIGTVYYSEELEIVTIKQLLFHQGVGDHCMTMVDVSTRSMIGLNEYKIVCPTARKL